VNIFKLALKNIRGNSIRSLIIFLCVMGVAAFFVSTTLVIRGAENSLNRGLDRIGADIIVVPQGTETKLESALLMGKPTRIWMNYAVIDRVKTEPGVEAVSPQSYLSSLYDASCCAVSEMFMVVYDPETDFTLRPWLEKNLGRSLKIGEVIGGSYIFTPPGDKYIEMYGDNLTLVGNLEATGTGLDQTMFFTKETARDMAKLSLTQALMPLIVPENSVSSLLVKVKPGADRHKIALQITQDVPAVLPIESPNLFGTFRQQMLGLFWGLLLLTGAAWALSTVLIGLIFSIAANERQREISVLRALGATHFYIFGALILEAAMIAVSAGVLGVSIGAALIFTFRDYIANTLRMPFLFPSPLSFLGLFAAVIALSLLTVTLGSFLPAYRITRKEPALAMRE
jgi:putative ABC transport system permease protein